MNTLSALSATNGGRATEPARHSPRHTVRCRHRPGRGTRNQPHEHPDLNILLVHPNFPAQFRHIARHLAQKGHRVLFLTASERQDWRIPDVRLLVGEGE